MFKKKNKDKDKDTYDYLTTVLLIKDGKKFYDKDVISFETEYIKQERLNTILELIKDRNKADDIFVISMIPVKW